MSVALMTAAGAAAATATAAIATSRPRSRHFSFFSGLHPPSSPLFSRDEEEEDTARFIELDYFTNSAILLFSRHIFLRIVRANISTRSVRVATNLFLVFLL